MRSITWPVHKGFPKTTENNFDPELSIYGATMTIKGWPTFIRAQSHVKVVFGRKKCPVRIGLQNGVFLLKI